MKVALVYDRVNKWGGAERVLLAFHELFPKAPLYTSVYNQQTAPWAKVFPKVIPSFLQKIPLARTRHDLFAPLMPFAFRFFDLSEYDLVISVTSEFAKGINLSPKTKHICYCLTPTRYLWSGYNQYLNSPLRRAISTPLINILRDWDKNISKRPDKIVAISSCVAQRIKKYYGRNAEVVYPPVEINSKSAREALQSILNSKQILNLNVKSSKQKGYFLVVSRLVPYKKVDLVVEAFNKLNLPLVIVGTGSEDKSLRKKSKSKNTIFAGHVSDDDLAEYYKRCKALIFPQEEDFGIVGVEVQAFGKPVIAYRGGGALETVVEGKTGIFFDKQKPESLIKCIRSFEKMNFKNQDCINNADKFSKKKFLKNFDKLTKDLICW